MATAPNSYGSNRNAPRSKTLFYPDDSPEVCLLIMKLIEDKYYVTRASKHQIKHGKVNYYPSSGVITIDGEGRHPEKGPQALLALLSVLGGVGLAVAGVPVAAVLTAVMFMLAIAQIGPLPVLWAIGGLALLERQHRMGNFSAFLDPGGRNHGQLSAPGPHQERRHLPLLLIFAGVVGGLMAIGLIGIFVGPVVLAVAHTLLSAWGEEEGTEIDSVPSTEVMEGSPSENASKS